MPFGVFLGYTSGEIVSHPMSANLARSSTGRNTRVSFRPEVGPGGAGVGLSLSF